MSLISASRCLPAALIFWRSGTNASWPQVLGLFLEHLAVADDRVQRRAQLVRRAGQEVRLVLAGRRELLVELPQLLGHVVDVGGEGAQLVDVGDLDAMREVALAHRRELAAHRLHRSHDGAGEHYSEKERQRREHDDHEQQHLLRHVLSAVEVQQQREAAVAQLVSLPQQHGVQLTLSRHDALGDRRGPRPVAGQVSGGGLL